MENRCGEAKDVDTADDNDDDDVRGSLYADLLHIGDNPPEQVEAVFKAVAVYIRRHYKDEMTQSDTKYLLMLERNGNPLLKLYFVLMCIPIDQAIRVLVEASATTNEDMCACKAFYRVLAIALRSVMLAPYTTANARAIVLSAMKFIYQGWACTGGKPGPILIYCNSFAAQPPELPALEDPKLPPLK
jgi:hypothetical protein